MFWLNYIKYLSTDVEQVETKTWLRTALRSHCEYYARLIGRNPEGIEHALDIFFYKAEHPQR